MKRLALGALVAAISIALASLQLHAQPGARVANADEEANVATPNTSDRLLRGPLASKNQFPFSLMVFFLAPERADTLPGGSTSIGLNLDYSNIIAVQESSDELLRLDAEYLSTAWTLRRGLDERTEIAAQVPFYIFYGGFLDSFIDGLHRSFGLPNFVRGQTPFGLTNWNYSIGAQTPIDRNEPFASLGDISLLLKRRLFAAQQGTLRLSARGGIKFPTGSVERASGSGSFDGGIGVAIEKIGPRFGGYLNLNWHALGEADGLNTRNYASIMAAIDIRFKKNLGVVIQFDQLQSSFESSLELFNQPARQIALGMRYRPSTRFVYEWRFVEDLSTTSPDFSFGFQWSWILD